MKKAVLIGFLTLLVTSFPAFGQFEQRRRSRERIDRMVKATEEREAAVKAGTRGETGLPAPKPAVTNVDVQAVLSVKDMKTFAEAKLSPVSRVTDGAPLWLYVKFKGKLGDYVSTVPNKDEPGKLKYLLYAEVGPQGDVTALNQYVLQFTKEELAATELKINLAPGLFGRNKSMPIFLTTAASVKPGVWNNEFRLANSAGLPRSAAANLTKTNIALDFAAGLEKYRRMEGEYDSIILRGSPDLTKMPVPGTFFSEPLKSEINAKLKAEGILPAKFYFSGDDWMTSTSGSMMAMKQTRQVFASYAYQKGEACFYGVAEVVQTYSSFNSKFGESAITLTNDLPITCAALN
ncbi:MAG: hypothetical protein WKF92_08370 [Pyrinomonadaceae bacterium]